jgi:hypothetical protein
MTYEKNEKLSELIENKTVVLVGPAQYLMNKNLGNIINQFDVVCRVNYMAPSEFINDYGDRTDIMFYNCATSSLEQMKQHFQEYPDFSKKLKLTVCPVVKVLGPENWTEWDDEFIAPVVKNFNDINIYNGDFHWVGMRNYKYLFNLIKCVEPNSGVLAMPIILEHNPKEFFVTGFTFYRNKNDSYFEGYATKAQDWRGVSGHPQESQINFFQKFIGQHNIQIDSYLNNLLKLNHHNVRNI